MSAPSFDLSEYEATSAAHERAGPTGWDLNTITVEKSVQGILRRFEQQKSQTSRPVGSTALAAAIASFVPRFYGRSDAEIFSSTLTIDDAQLIVAREFRFMSWQLLNARIAEIQRYRDNPKFQRVPEGTNETATAIRERDGAALVKLYAEFPDCFPLPDSEGARVGAVWDIVRQFITDGDGESRVLLDLLTSAGVDVQGHLNSFLMGGPFFRIESNETRALLALGANPNWIPRDGCSILDHAIARYWNGEAVDVIALAVAPRKALWIAAGLGDVNTMLTFIDANGKPTDAARRDRPDMLRLGVMRTFARAMRPNATDIEILCEAFWVAGLNGRVEATHTLLDLGVPIDHVPAVAPLLYFSAHNKDIAMVEMLLMRGANPRTSINGTGDCTLNVVERMLEQEPGDLKLQHIHALLSR